MEVVLWGLDWCRERREGLELRSVVLFSMREGGMECIIEVRGLL